MKQNLFIPLKEENKMEEYTDVNEVVEAVAEKAPEIVENVVEKVQQAIQPVEIPNIVVPMPEKKYLGMDAKTAKDVLVVTGLVTLGGVGHKCLEVCVPKVVAFGKRIWNAIKGSGNVQVQQEQPAPAQQPANPEPQPVQQTQPTPAPQENK